MILAYSDPVALGFAASLAQPGGNITGVLMAAEPTMAAKRLELIKEAVPRAARIAALTTPEPPSRTQVQFMERAAPALGVKLIVIEVRFATPTTRRRCRSSGRRPSSWPSISRPRKRSVSPSRSPCAPGRTT